MRARINIRLIVLCVLCCALCLPAVSEAKVPYEAYIYDSESYDMPSLHGYLYYDSIDGYDLPTGPFNSPEDIFVTEDDQIYIVDSGNNRVIQLDTENNVIATYGDEEGEGQLNGPRGVFVTAEHEVFVADTLHKRIVVFNASGAYKQHYDVPESPLLGDRFVYSPAKLIVDKRGYMFVVSDGTSQGMMQNRPDGSFAGFYGANHVPFDWTRIIINLIATPEQKAQLANVRPPEFSNLFQDSEGFIYTTSLGIRQDQIKRLSAVGVDTLNPHTPRRYGGWMPLRNYEIQHETFVDLTVNQYGYITGLDQTTGKLFQYDEIGNLLFIFGGNGDQDGLFKTAVSVAETSDGLIYVADRARNRIDRFRPTLFADKVHEASRLYVEGRYEESLNPWQEVLKMNSNYELAYYAIGKSLYRQQKYKEAMAYFKIARDSSEYSNALNQYRKVYLRQNFGMLLTSAVLIIIFYQLIKFMLRRNRFRKSKPTVANGGGEGWS